MIAHGRDASADLRRKLRQLDPTCPGLSNRFEHRAAVAVTGRRRLRRAWSANGVVRGRLEALSRQDLRQTLLGLRVCASSHLEFHDARNAVKGVAHLRPPKCSSSRWGARASTKVTRDGSTSTAALAPCFARAAAQSVSRTSSRHRGRSGVWFFTRAVLSGCEGEGEEQSFDLPRVIDRALRTARPIADKH